MPTFVSLDNNSTATPMSESDNDDDNEQNSSFNQQNESMIHKVKDVVSKLLHPSFLFSTSGDTNRPKRKREKSTEENDEHQTSEVVTVTDSQAINGHLTVSKSKYNRKPKSDNEPQLTDDEDNNDRSVSPTEQNLADTEQQKKRRRTIHYQHTTSTTTTNGHHEDDERSSLHLNSTNIVGSSSNRRIINNGLVTSNTTPVLLQTSTDQRNNEGTNRLTSSTKQRFNIPSTNRGFTSNYDPSQSPLFSVGTRKTIETPITPNRTTTNLKSNLNEFSTNYLLATGLVNRTQPIVPSTQETPSNLLSRSSSNDRQLLGVNYASINTRRLPYIERLRRRTLQDCIRLNRTLDSEPLSISTIEEHTSTIAASPARKSMKAPEKECGIQCNISTSESMEPSRKIPRTFPPADIRKEALSIPSTDTTQSTCQTDSYIQTKSSITIESVQPINDIKKPKVLGNITPFCWPKFARAQEDFATKYPEKCRLDNILPQPTKQAAAVIEKSTANPASSIVSQANVSSQAPKIPIFSVSPPRSTKPVAGPIWQCPSCSMEHPAQTASCSLCHRINPDYKRLTVIESTTTPTSSSSSKSFDTIIQEPVVSKPVVTTQTTTSTESAPSVTLSTKENTLTMPSSLTTTAPLSTITTSPVFGITPAATKEHTTTTNTPSTTTPLFPAIPTTTTATPLFGTTTAPLFGTTTTTTAPPPFGTLATGVDKTATTTTASSLFQSGITSTTTLPSFGTLPSMSTPATVASTSTSTASSILTTTSASPVKISTPITFGSFSSTPVATVTATTTASSIISSISTDKPPLFTFGTSTTIPSLLPPPSTATTSSPSLFAFQPNTTATTTSSVTLPSSLTLPTPSGLPSSAGFPTASTTFGTSATSTALPLFGSVAASTSSSGFSFPTIGTTTTASSNTPFTFGALSPPRPFAPSVISSTSTAPAATFGATASFGTNPATGDKLSSSLPPFSGFGSTTTAAPLFSFGAASNTAMNSTQPAVPPTGTTSGFSFAPSSTTAAAPAPAFGSSTTSFAFGANSTATSTNAPFQFSASPAFSFGAGAAAPSSGTPFQFSASPAPSINTSLPGGFSGTAEKNPFSCVEESSNTRTASKAGRPVIKAKRQAKS